MSLHTRLFLAPLAIAFIALVASWPAFAQTEAERKACEPDAQLHCPDEMPDRAKVQAIFNDWAAETGLALGHLSMTLAASVD